LFLLATAGIQDTQNIPTKINGKHTSTWLLIMGTLSQIITISFSIYLHWTYTYACTTQWINTSQWNSNKGNGTYKLQINSSIERYIIKIILYLSWNNEYCGSST